MEQLLEKKTQDSAGYSLTKLQPSHQGQKPHDTKGNDIHHTILSMMTFSIKIIKTRHLV